MATAGLLAALVALLGLLAKVALRGEPAPPDPLLMLWHQYEMGDLTRREFERQKNALTRRELAPAIQWTRPPTMDPAARPGIIGGARPYTRGAAAGSKATRAVIYEASSAERTSPGSA